MTSLRALLLVALLAPAACRQAPDTNAVAEDESAAREAAAAPAADINDSLALDQLAGAENHMAAPEGYGALPPEDRALRFVGRWAAEEPLCRSQAWRFTPDGLETPGHSVCRFTDIAPVEGGYDIAARCAAEAPERDDVIRLRFDETTHAMTFAAESVAGTDLVYCGPNE